MRCRTGSPCAAGPPVRRATTSTGLAWAGRDRSESSIVHDRSPPWVERPAAGAASGRIAERGRGSRYRRDHQVGLVDLKFTDLPGTQVPTSLDRVLEVLDADHEFLLAREVFTSDLIDAYLEHKRREVHEVRLRPHSWKFALYFDV